MLICRENTKMTGVEVVKVDDGFSWLVERQRNLLDVRPHMGNEDTHFA